MWSRSAHSRSAHWRAHIVSGSQTIQMMFSFPERMDANDCWRCFTRNHVNHVAAWRRPNKGALVWLTELLLEAAHSSSTKKQLALKLCGTQFLSSSLGRSADSRSPDLDGQSEMLMVVLVVEAIYILYPGCHPVDGMQILSGQQKR